MKISIEFGSYEEMMAFGRTLNGENSPEPRKDPEPEKEKDSKPAPETVEDEAPFTEDPKPKPQIKKEDVRRLLAKKKKEGKDVSAVIRTFGVEMFKDIPEESYPDLLQKVEAL